MPPPLKSFTTSASDRSHEIERDVRSCTPAGSNKLRPLQPKRTVCDIAQKFLSYFGKKNPWPQPITRHDELWLWDNTAFLTTKRDLHGRHLHIWRAEFVTAVFSQEPSCIVSDAVVQMAEMIGLADDEEAKKTIETRLRPFILHIQPGKRASVRYGGDTALELGPGGRSGISSDVKTIDAAPAGTIRLSNAQVPKSTTGLLENKTFFADAHGWGIISDLDDTIKVTMTGEASGILRSTFVDKPQPVKGMPQLYKFLQSQVTAASPFFYLSASPYNLYPLVRDFRDEHFPHGQIILRDSSWMSVPGLISNVTLGTQDYKTDRIGKIHGWLPQKNFIVIGDSTQTDPETYAEAYRNFGPQWIRLILIRRVTGVAVIGIEEKNKLERFEKAFTNVPRSVWYVFDDPSECYERIGHIVSSIEEGEASMNEEG